MKSVLYFLILIAVNINIHAQSLSVFDVDSSNFPIMKAMFYAFDNAGKQISNLSSSSFELKENGLTRTITSVSCPAPQPPKALSSVLTFDISGSISGERLRIVKNAAALWANSLNLGQSECAITSFDDKNYLNQDFTTDRTKLLNAINGLRANGGTDYNEGLYHQLAGSLQISKNGKHKRVVVFLTDGLPNSAANVNKIIAEANLQNCVIYSVVVGMNCPHSLKDISLHTGGNWYENINTEAEIKRVYLEIIRTAQGGSPCNIEWQSSISCTGGLTNIEIKLLPQNISAIASYQSPNTAVAKLEFEPAYLRFENPELGVKAEKKVKVTARNADYNISAIIPNNNKYTVSPSSLTLQKGESIELTVTYTPAEKAYTFCKLDFQTNVCPTAYYLSGGQTGTPPSQKTLEITKPFAGDLFIAGSDTIITWTGIPETDTVSLEYSLDNGASWKLITKKATGLKYKWQNLPKPASVNCKIRAMQVMNSANTGEPGSLQFTLGSHTGEVNYISWSPDGSRVATAVSDGTGIIWDASTGTKLHTLSGHTGDVNHISWSPDGSRVATASYDKTGIIWDASTGTKLHTLSGHTGDVNHISWSPDSRRVATASWDDTGIIWDAFTGTKLHTLSTQDGGVYRISWNPDGTKVATASWDDTGIIWDAATGAKLHTLSGHTDNVVHISWSPDGTKVATASYDETGIIWDASTGTKLYTLSGHTGNLYHISWSPDGSRIATASSDRTGIIWDVSTGTKIHTLGSGHTSWVVHISWSPDGSRIATASSDRTGIIWDASTGAKLNTLSGHTHFVNHISWSPDGSKVTTASRDYKGIIWDASTGTKLHILSGHLIEVNHISWSPDGTKVATASKDGKGIIWDASTGTKLHTLSGHTSWVENISWSPDGSRLATASLDFNGIIWDASTGTKLHTLSGHTNRVYYISWSPDGSRLATASRDNKGIIWDASTGTKLYTLSGHTRSVYHISWSPDGSRLATASDDSTGIVWDASTGTKLHTLSGHIGDVILISWSPDGSRLATASNDKTGIIWDASTGTKLHILSGHTSWVEHISWSPDGSRAATVSLDRTGIIWDAVTGNKLLTLSHPGYVGIISWSPDGSRIATARGDRSGIIWDAVTGNKLYTLSGHINNINHISWSPDGSRVATASDDKTAKIWIIVNTSYVLQADESEVFSIAEPLAKAKDINMGYCLLTTAKEKMETNFIANTGTWRFRVDSIYFRGADADAFSIVSGTPVYSLEAGENKSAEFRFTPNRVGEHNAEIVIVTQAQTLRYNIKGIGLLPQVEVISDLLDFGEWEIGQENTISDTELIRNISSVPINFNAAQMLGPDLEQFEIISGGEAFTLQPGETHKMTLKFKVKYGGRTSGRLAFKYNGAGSPAVVRLFGTGIGGMVKVPNDSAFPGEQKLIQLVLERVKPEGLSKLASSFEAKLRFQKTILAPAENLQRDYSLDSVIVSVSGQIGSSEILAEVPVIAALGSVTETLVELLEVKLFDESGNQIDYDLELEPGLFKILGISEVGGQQLIDSEGEVIIKKISPNPSDGNINIEINLMENGKSVVSIVNDKGEIIETREIINSKGINTISLDARKYSSGLYFINLETQTLSIREKFVVVK